MLSFGKSGKTCRATEGRATAPRVMRTQVAQHIHLLYLVMRLPLTTLWPYHLNGQPVDCQDMVDVIGGFHSILHNMM